MTATLRFGIPATGDAEQTVLGTRWGAEPSGAASDAFFPFAVAITSTAFTAAMRNMTGAGNESVDPDSAGGLPKTLFHPESGLLANGITDIAFFNDGDAANTVAATWPGRCRMIAGLEDDLAAWFVRGTVPSDGFATLDALVQPAVDAYADNPDVYAFILDDDLTAFDGVDDPKDDLATQAMARVAALDVANRPGSPSLLGSNFLPPTVTPGAVIVLGSGTYASRWTSTGVKRAEGDFTIDSATWTEWADVIVDQVEAFPDARVWWWCQAHQLGDGSDQNHLSYPTAREIRKMVWEAIGAGAKGLIWFIYQDTEDWDGLAHPNSRSRLQALAEMNARIDRGIRQRLLRCAPASALFSASGGGSAAWAHETYANAGVRTLHDAGTGTYYCVAVNRSTSTASVTLSGVGVSGSLVDLETGASTDLGSAVSLPALDGAIYRFVPSDAYGVPHHMPNASLTTEQWWATHWANPDSVNYVAYGDIETHPNAIDVDASDDLQAIVDAAPDDTTFRLGPGNHGKVYAVGRSGLHFVAADPMDRPTMNAAYIHASVLNADYESFVDAVVNDDDADAIALYLDPPRDFLFRDIDFVPVTGELAGLDAFAECINFACIADVCIEGCTFGGYRWVDNTGGAVGPIKSGAHGGYVTGTAGVHNVVVRNCEATPVTYAGQSFRAWAVFAYVDGAAGCVIADNTINGSTGFNGGFALFLTNDDFAPSTATAYDGVAGYDEISGEIPHARYNAVFRNTGGPSAFRVDYGGRNLLMAENEANVWANVAKVVSLDARDPSHSVGLVGYLQYDSVIRDNAYTGGNVTGRFVEHLFENNSLGQSEYGRGSRVGRTTITGNSVGGTCAKWYETVDTSTAQDAVATTPITATNNTDSGGSRDGV